MVLQNGEPLIQPVVELRESRKPAKRRRKQVTQMGNLIRMSHSELHATIEVLDALGVEPEDFERVRQDRSLAEKVAEAFASARQAAKNIFTFLIKPGNRTTEEVLAAIRHTFVNKLINSKNFPMRPQESGKRVIEFLEFDFDPTSEQVLAEAARRGLARPSYEDALLFDEAHPDLQGVFVFLHEPWQGPRGGPGVIYLGRFGSRRYVDLGWFGHRWGRGGRFGFLRKSL